MDNITKDDQLLHFIENKYQKDILDTKDIYYMFIKAFENSLIKTYTKLHNIDYSISCSNMIVYIFWIIISYTNNLKLTMFLCERAIILFNEYITLSNSMTSNDPINIIDVKIFIYKKTIGPIIMNNHYNIYYDKIKKLINISLELLNHSFIQLIENNINIESIQGISNLLIEIMVVLNKLNHTTFIEKNILIILNNLNKHQNIIYEINMLKIKLELYYYIISNHKINPYNTYKQVLNKCVLDNYYYNNLLNKEEFTKSKLFNDLIKVL